MGPPIIGLVTKLAGKGISIGAEYKEHRKEQKQARVAATGQLERDAAAGNIGSHQASTTEAAPAYTYSERPSERTLRPGSPATADRKGHSEMSSDEDLDSDDVESIQDDEGLQALDDVLDRTNSEGLPSYDEFEAQYVPVDELIRDVMATRPPALAAGKTRLGQQLPCPVIIPQRRPRNKARGFVRAYAPVLNDCGISQETFLAFLKNFHKSSQASPIFPIIQISAAIAGFAPSVIAMAVTTAVQVAAGVGKEMQSRSRTNNFLDTMNEELFKPAGLYAMIVKYKSETSTKSTGLASLIRAEKVDLTTNQSIAKYKREERGESGSRSMGDRMKDLRLASGTTRGAAMLPDSAALIFPELDDQMVQAGPESFKDKTKDAKKFLADYFDRRAQMDYAYQDPNSALAVPAEQREFKSALGDPNHPMYSGSLLAFVSGGKLAGTNTKQHRRMERNLMRDERRLHLGRAPRQRKRQGPAYYEELYSRTGYRAEGFAPSTGSAPSTSLAGSSSESTFQREVRGQNARRRNKAGGGPLGMVKKAMKEDVLYLIVVNMPSEAELAEARDELERAKAAGQH